MKAKTHRTLDARGRVQSSYETDRGQVDGEALAYDDQGQVKRRDHYSRGRLHGVTEIFEDGRLVARQNHERGQAHGTWTDYDAEGRESLICNYVSGELHGEVRTFRDGVLRSLHRFENGKLEGESESYDASGQGLETRSRYQDNQLHGIYELYSPEGRLQKTMTYAHAVLDGETRSFDPKGVVRMLEIYRAGELVDALEYDERGRAKKRIKPADLEQERAETPPPAGLEIVPADPADASEVPSAAPTDPGVPQPGAPLRGPVVPSSAPELEVPRARPTAPPVPGPAAPMPAAAPSPPAWRPPGPELDI